MTDAPLVMLITLLTLAIAGCQSKDDRLVEMAREHAARQSETQRQMSVPSQCDLTGGTAFGLAGPVTRDSVVGGLPACGILLSS